MSELKKLGSAVFWSISLLVSLHGLENICRRYFNFRYPLEISLPLTLLLIVSYLVIRILSDETN